MLGDFHAPSVKWERVHPRPVRPEVLCGLRTQLEERHWPLFPSAAWWSALRLADREQEYIRPVNGYGPIMSQKVQLKGEPPRNFDWKTQAPGPGRVRQVARSVRKVALRA